MRYIHITVRRRVAPLLLIACLLTAAPASAQKPAPKAGCRAGEASFFRDEGLAVKVSTKLKFTKALLRERINVKVSGGVATLSGGVATQEQVALAGNLAAQGLRCPSR